MLLGVLYRIVYRLQGKMIELIFSMFTMACNFCCFLTPYRYVVAIILSNVDILFIIYEQELCKYYVTLNCLNKIAPGFQYKYFITEKQVLNNQKIYYSRMTAKYYKISLMLYSQYFQRFGCGHYCTCRKLLLPIFSQIYLDKNVCK